MIKENNIQIRAISVFLVVSMLVTSLFNSLLATAYAEMAVTTDNVQDDISKTATINDTYSDLWMVKDPSSLTTYTGDWYMRAVEGEDYVAGVEFIITDAYVSSVSPYGIFYRVEAVNAENLLTSVITDSPWVFQRYQDDLVEYATLILHDVDEGDEDVTEVELKNNGVYVSGDIPQNVALNAEEVEADAIKELTNDFDETSEYNLNTIFPEGITCPHIAMDIKLMHGTEAWQPDEDKPVTVSVDAEKYGFAEGDEFVVFHLHEEDNGDFSPQWLGPYEITDGKATFEMSRFSYVLLLNTTTYIENVNSFYPGTLEGSDSTNDHFTFLGVYYDKEHVAHFLLAYAKNTNNAESKLEDITIDTTTYEKSKLKYSIKNTPFTKLILQDEEGNTVYASPNSNNKGYGGILDITLDDSIKVQDGYFFGVNSSGGQGWKIGGNLVLELKYDIKKTVATGTSSQGDFTNSVTVERGDWVIYRIELNNTGTSPLEAMIVQDILPDGVFDMNTAQMSIDGENGEIGNWEPFEKTMFDNYSSQGNFSRLLYIKAQVDPNLNIEKDTTYTNRVRIDGMGMPTKESTADITVKAPATGTLIVSKAVTSANPNDPAPKGVEYEFKVTSNSNDTGDLPYTVNGVKKSITNGGTFTLKNGESAHFEGFPVGNFTIEELDNSGYTTKVNGEEGTKFEGVMEGDGSPVVAFENQFALRDTNLIIKKVVKKALENDTLPGDEFTFEVVIDDAMDSSSYFCMIEGRQEPIPINGGGEKNILKLKDGETAVISNIPVKATYTVNEILGDLANDYTCTIDGNNNDAMPLEGATVTFINTYKPHLTTLTIEKAGANDIDENQSFVFEVTGTDENNKDTLITVVIHGNNSITIKNLPVGNYKVTEITNWSWRYSPNKNDIEVNVDANGKTVNFTNERNEIFWLDGNAYCDNRFGKL